MSIPETISFDKHGEAVGRGLPLRARHHVRNLFLSLVILLVSALSFGIGRLTAQPAGQGIKIEYDPSLSAAAAPLTSESFPRKDSAPSSLSTPSGSVVASKSGSKYHYPSCPGAKQIKESNKISFPSAQAAEAAGYTLAANCSRKP